MTAIPVVDQPWDGEGHLRPGKALPSNLILMKSSCHSPSPSAAQPASVPPKAIAVDAKTAAEMLSICTRTLFEEMDRGNIRGFRIGRAWRFRIEEINNYIARQEKKQAAK